MAKKIKLNARKKLREDGVVSASLKGAVANLTGIKDIEGIDDPFSFDGTNNLEESYKKRTETIANAARRICNTLKPTDDSNPELTEKIAHFENYIKNLAKNYIIKQDAIAPLPEYKPITTVDIETGELKVAPISKATLKARKKEGEAILKRRQKIYNDYLKHLEFAIADQILPFTKDKLPYTDEAPKKMPARMLQKVKKILGQDKKPNKKAKKLAGRLLNAADIYEEVGKDDRPILATVVTSKDGKSIVQMDVPLEPISDVMRQEFLNAKPDKPTERPKWVDIGEGLAVLADDETSPIPIQPLWYQAMPKEEKLFFDYMMRDVTDATTTAELNSIIHSISSRLRGIPGVANFSRHTVAAVDPDGTVTQTPARYRSSMVSSRDLYKLKIKNKKDKKDLGLNVTIQNIEKIIEAFLKDKFPGRELSSLKIEEIQDIPILLQTLISPIKVGKIKWEPDLSLFEDKQKAVEHIIKHGCRISGRKEPVKFKNIIATNHSLNKGRHISGTGMLLEYRPEINQASADKIVALANQKISSEPGTKLAIALNSAVDEFLTLRELKIRLKDNNQREMHLAALEEFIVLRLGGLSYGSCVSGKDRKGTEIIYMDAFEEYYRQYGVLPRYDEPNPVDRKKFVDIFVDLFLSYHQQLNAGLNASGAEGIKTAGIYLPDDIKEAIIERTGNPHIFDESSKVGDNNDSTKVLKKAKKNELSDAEKAEARKEFNALVAPEEAAKEIATGNYSQMVAALTKLKDHIIKEGKFSKSSDIVTRLEQQIRLLEAIPLHDDFKDQLKDCEKALEDLPTKFADKLKGLSPIEGLPGKDALEQFQTLSKKAVGTLNSQIQNELKGEVADPNILPIKLQPEDNGNEENAIRRIALARVGVAAAPKSTDVFAALSTGVEDLTLSQKISSDQVLVRTIETSTKPIVIANTLKNGVAKSTAYQVPDDLIPQNIWNKLHKDDGSISGYFTDADKFNTLFEEVMRKQGLYGKDKDLEKNIYAAMKESGYNDPKAANYLFTAYTAARDKAMYSNRDKKGALIPSDDLIRLAMKQVDGLGKGKSVLNPEEKLSKPTLTITRGSSEAYVKTVMLYAAVQEYPIVNHTNFKAFEPLNTKEVERFREYLTAKQKLYGYHDMRVAKKDLKQVVSEQKKLSMH